MSEELQQLERQKQLAAQRKAQKQAEAEAAARRRRRLVRIEIAAFVASALVVAWVLYNDTTRVADDFFAVHLRLGKLVDVHDGGHVYRIPILDKVVLIDKGGRPVPTLRRSVKSAIGTAVTYEALIDYSVADAERYWARFRSDEAGAVRMVSHTVETATAAAIGGMGDAQLTSADAARTVAAAVLARIKAELANAGLTMVELRLTSLRVMP